MEQDPSRQNNMQFSGAADSTCSEDDEFSNFEDSLIPGCRFIPTDEELIEDYLKKKVNKERLPPNIILDVIFYSKDPTQLKDEYKPITENEWYFFTPRDKKYPNGSRPNRATPNGYWKPTGKEKNIPHGSRHPIGKKRTLDFYEGKHPGGSRSEWKMHEYKLVNNTNNHNSQNNGRPRGDMTLDDWVLCRLYKNQRNGGDEASSSGSGTQSTTVNAADNYGEANPMVGSSNFELEDQASVNVPQNNEAYNSSTVENSHELEDQSAVNAQNNEAYLMAGNMSMASEYQDPNAQNNEAYLTAGNISMVSEYQNPNAQNNEAYLTAGNMSMVSEHQNPNALNNEAYLMAGNMSMVSEYQNPNASQATPYQGSMRQEPVDWQSSCIANPPPKFIYEGDLVAYLFDDRNFNKVNLRCGP